MPPEPSDDDFNFRPVRLSDGTQLVVPDPNRLTIQRVREDIVLDELSLPYGNVGHGGGHLLVSRSQRMALVCIFSGQSEEGYVLIGLTDRFRVIGEMKYQFGEAASHAFSPDEATVVMALPLTCVEWWQVFDDGEVEEDGAGRVQFEFGTLFLQDVATEAISRHPIWVSVPNDWQPSRGQYDPFRRPTFVSPTCLTLALPWAVVQVPFPPPPVITLRPTP